MTETYDVVIVGCGTVGEYLSLALGAAGHRVAVVERWPQVYPLPRAVHFDDEVARLLRTVGLDARTSPAVEQYDDVYRWVNADKEVLLDLDWRGTGPSGWPTSSFFSQPDLDRELVRAMAEVPNITVLRGWEVQDLAEDADGVTVTARSMRPQDAGALATLELRGRYVVGADGANSFVRRWTRAELHDLGFAFDWLIVDMVPNEPMHFDPPAWQWCDPAGPTSVVPGGPGRRRWEFMRLPHETVEELNRVETAWERMAAWGLTPENSVLERHAVYTFRATWVRPEHWRRGRVLLAGDAAHLAPPFAGQGMGAGIRDAQNLGWKLDAVLAGRATDELLDTYGPERGADVQSWVAYAVGLGEIICVLDPTAAAERDARMRAAVADPGLAPSPPPRALTAGVIGSHHAAGRLSHQFRVRRGDVVDPLRPGRRARLGRHQPGRVARVRPGAGEPRLGRAQRCRPRERRRGGLRGRPRRRRRRLPDLVRRAGRRHRRRPAGLLPLRRRCAPGARRGGHGSAGRPARDEVRARAVNLVLAGPGRDGGPQARVDDVPVPDRQRRPGGTP